MPARRYLDDGWPQVRASIEFIIDGTWFNCFTWIELLFRYSRDARTLKLYRCPPPVRMLH